MTSGFLARIFRLRRFGHHWLFASPWVGCTRPWTTGQPSELAPPVRSAASGVWGSVVTGSWSGRSAIEILPVARICVIRERHADQERRVEQSGPRPQQVTPASSIAKPWSPDAVRQGASPAAQSTSATEPGPGPESGRGSRHAAYLSPVKANLSGKRTTQVETMPPTLSWLDAG